MNRLVFNIQEDHPGPAGVDRALLNSTLFIIPANDGEAIRCARILKAAAAPHVHVSSQQWGATLDREWEHFAHRMPATVRAVAIMEMPAEAPSGKAGGPPTSPEEKLRNKGYDLHIIDHHRYRWTDRFHKLSSIEQLCQLINWTPDFTDTAIGVNDRSWIPGLKAMGLTTGEIREVREFDLISQGNTRTFVNRQIRQANRAIQERNIEKHGSCWVMGDDRPGFPWIMQELAMADAAGLVHGLALGHSRMGYSGDPAVVNALMNLDYAAWSIPDRFTYWSGGDPDFSCFWGFKMGDSGTAIPEELRRAVRGLTLGNSSS